MDQDGRLDTYERLTAWAARWRAAHPALVARSRMVWCVASWLALLVGLVTLVLVPSTRAGVVVMVTVQYVLVQLWLLSRSKTVRWRSVARALTVGTVFAPLIGLADVAVMRLFGLVATDDAALIWVAGPVEEALKVLPLLVMLRVASQRARRLAVVDYALFGMALGAGFQLVEDWIRRVSAGRPGLFGALLGDGSTQFRVLALFPGWQDSPWGEAFFAGHFLLTALVAIGIRWARRLQPRWGRRAALLPVGLFVLVVLDHSLYNFHATLGTGPVPVWLVALHGWWGAGREVRWLFVALLLAAVVADHEVLERVGSRLPGLPGRPPAGGLVVAARPGGRRSRWPRARPGRVLGPTCRGRRRGGAARGGGCGVGGAARASGDAGRRPGQSGRLVHRHGGAARTLQLGFALWVDDTDPLRVAAVAPVVRADTERLTRLLLTAAACLVGLLALTLLARTGGDLAEPVFLANLFDDLGRWWNGLALWQQFLVMGFGSGC